MTLSQSQRAIFEKARQLGSGAQGVALDEGTVRALVAVIADDLGLRDRIAFPLPNVPQFFDAQPPSSLTSDPEGSSLQLFEALVEALPDGDTYFASLAALHKGRLKFERILATQPFPTLDQVGPRALLEYGAVPPPELVALLSWRKWMFDIDNRAGQETGYLFEPIIASAIGGVSVSAARSPVRRRGNPARGRQVDCLRGRLAYEMKLRVTIAASGQGRWREELDFPEDCRSSGYEPVLIVFDPTDNAKLRELVRAFQEAGGSSYVGAAAWSHLESAAGPTMAVFLEKYVRAPLAELLLHAPTELNSLSLLLETDQVILSIGDSAYAISRDADGVPFSEDRGLDESDGSV